MKFLAPLLLITCIAPAAYGASSHDLQSLLTHQDETAYGPLTEDRRKALAERASCICNPLCTPNTSIDYTPSQPSKLISCNIVPRSVYTELIEELFYRNGPWDKKGNCIQKCFVATQRNGCNACTFGATLAPFAALAACGLCASVITTCCVDSNYICNCPCSNPAVYNFMQENINQPTLATFGLSSAALLYSVFGTLYTDRLSNPDNWKNTEENNPQSTGMCEDSNDREDIE